MKRLTEQQLRQVIREELKSVLFEQEEKEQQQKSSGIKKLLLPAFLAALAMAQGHDITGGGSAEGASKTETYEQLMKQAGIDSTKAAELLDLAGFKKKSSEKLNSILTQKEQLNSEIKEYENLKENPPEGKAVDEEKVDRLISTKLNQIEELDKVLVNDEEISKGIMNAGPVAMEYLLNKGVLTGDEKTDYHKMMKYGVENAPLIAAQTAEKDIEEYSKHLGIIGQLSPGEKVIGWLGLNHQETLSDVTSDPTRGLSNIEIVSKLKQIDDTGFQFKTFEYFNPQGNAIQKAKELLNNPANSYDASEVADAMEAVSKSPRREEYSEERLRSITPEEIKRIQDPDARAAVTAAKAKLKESKVNKLRQRLNELRGVYV